MFVLRWTFIVFKTKESRVGAQTTLTQARRIFSESGAGSGHVLEVGLRICLAGLDATSAAALTGREDVDMVL
jgi:hypothetical protein